VKYAHLRLNLVTADRRFDERCIKVLVFLPRGNGPVFKRVSRPEVEAH